MYMLLSLLRVVFGLIVAWLSAALVLVLFVITPAEIAGLEPAAMGERLMGAGILALLAATQMAIFSAPFALLLTGFGEWREVGSWLYYAIGGIAIAMAGFLAQRAAETGEATIVNDYALRAYLAAGFAAGLVYWLVSGRKAGASRKGEKAAPARAPA
jgi:hypothetical protein